MPPGNSPPTEPEGVWPYIGVGCLTTVAGFFGGGMIAALVAKVVGTLRHCTPQEGFPACDTWSFVLPGAIVGVIVLPTVAIYRLRQSRKSETQNSSSEVER